MSLANCVNAGSGAQAAALASSPGVLAVVLAVTRCGFTGDAAAAASESEEEGEEEEEECEEEEA